MRGKSNVITKLR